MKSIGVVFVILWSFGSLQAQEFHPYKVRSGKITFEKRKYSLQTKLHIDSHGNMSGSRNNPSYVEEEVTYYWDNYGDVAYEVAYKVSEFGGKILPQRVKQYEMLWKGNHRYYYDVKKKKVSDDPYHTRKKCLKTGIIYEVVGCLSVMYPKASVLGEESVSEKRVKHYKESESYDFHVWNGIILREINYSTKKKNGEYKRFEPDREKIAVNIEIDTKVDKSVFNPHWLVDR